MSSDSSFAKWETERAFHRRAHALNGFEQTRGISGDLILSFLRALFSHPPSQCLHLVLIHERTISSFISLREGMYADCGTALWFGCVPRGLAHALDKKPSVVHLLCIYRVLLAMHYWTNIICVVQLNVFMWPGWSQSRRWSFPDWFGQTSLSLFNKNHRNRLNSGCQVVRRVLARHLYACSWCCCLYASSNTNSPAVALAFVQLAGH